MMFKLWVVKRLIGWLDLKTKLFATLPIQLKHWSYTGISQSSQGLKAEWYPPNKRHLPQAMMQSVCMYFVQLLIASSLPSLVNFVDWVLFEVIFGLYWVGWVLIWSWFLLYMELFAVDLSSCWSRPNFPSLTLGKIRSHLISVTCVSALRRGQNDIIVWVIYLPHFFRWNPMFNLGEMWKIQSTQLWYT